MSRPARLLVTTAATVCTATLVCSGTASADPTPPDHHTVICESATFYAHYAQGSGPFDPLRTLYAGNDVGHTDGSGEGEINGWVYSQDFGPNDWGWILRSCLS